MMFTAFVDESGAHADAPTMVMAAALGTTRQWELFGRRLSALQREFGFKIFHSTEFRGKSGEFRAWSDEKRARLLVQFTELVNEMTCVCMTLEHERFEREFRGKFGSSKVLLDSQYGVCFRHVLLRLISMLRQRGQRHLLNIVMEGGHRNANDAARIFEETREEAMSAGVTLLGEITIAQKNERPPLMAADYLAFVTYKQECERMSAPVLPAPPSRESILETHNITLIPGGLDLHHGQLTEIQKRRRGRRRRSGA